MRKNTYHPLLQDVGKPLKPAIVINGKDKRHRVSTKAESECKDKASGDPRILLMGVLKK